ncbi:hypothetical protein ACFLXY_11570 [Chloroflexota bacterium]
MKKLLIVLTAILIFCLTPGVAQALGVAVGPTNIVISDALRGGEYGRTITIFNPSPEETEYIISTDGVAADWLSFHDQDTGQAIGAKLTIAGDNKIPVLVKIKIPDDMANGTYNAQVTVKTIPPESLDGTGVSTIMQAKSTLSVVVAGEQVRAGEVIRISVVDTEVGIPARIETLFKNTGNVKVKPRIDCEILKGTEKVTEISHSDTEVGVEGQDVIIVEWNTDDQREGEYTAKVSVFLDDRLLTTKEIPFELFAPGTLTKEGELVSFEYKGQPALNSLVKLEGIFSNTGQATSYAKLITEIYLDGVLVDTVDGEKILAPVGQQVVTSVYYTFEQAGRYTIKGFITFDGKQTDTREIDFVVEAESNIDDGTSSGGTSNNENGTDSKGSNAFLTIGLPIIIVVLLISSGLVIYYRRSRGNTKSDSSTDQ